MNDAPSSPTVSEVRETLDAIASGEVDAVVVQGPQGPQVYRLEGPDQPFRAFVEKMQEGVLTLSIDGTILYANTYFARLVGVPVHEVIGAPISRFVPSTYQFIVEQRIRGGVSGTVKVACRLESGAGTIPVQLTLSPMVGGSQASCCAVVFDLREREATERAIAARAAAEAASIAKDQFLAILSHELRSPLNTILGWSHILLSDQTLSEKSRKAVQTIERNARTQAGLIADLLDISRIAAGKLSLEKTQVDLGALVESVLSDVRPLLAQKAIALRYSIGDDAEVYGDPTRLQQVVTNLLNNAMKFTDAGGSLDVTLERAGDVVVLAVADTGIGMSRALLARVFDVFHQGEGAKRRSGGLGLGLAIAKQLVEAHGGTLTAASLGEGRGSTFTVRLPRPPRSIRPPPPVVLVPGELAGLSVLLVDCDRDELDMIADRLQSSGGRVTKAISAEGALGALAERDYGLLIANLALREEDGLALLREVRARGLDEARLPAIALAGAYSGHDARAIRGAGYQAELAAPVDVVRLIALARELGRRSRGPSE